MESSEYFVRQATAAEAYCFLWETVYRASGKVVPLYPAFFLMEYQRQCSESVLAEKGGEVVGVGTLFINGYGNINRPALGTMYVLPHYRGHGLGLRMLRQALERFAEMTDGKVVMDVVTTGMHTTVEKLKTECPELGARIVEFPSYQHGEEDFSWFDAKLV